MPSPAAAEVDSDAAGSDDDEPEDEAPEGDTDSSSADSAFLLALREAVRACPAYAEHASLLEECCTLAGVQWRERFWEDKPLWKRIRRGRRLAKELSEIAPVLSRARKAMETLELPPSGQRLVILDLCSGFGYLAMFLSEILAPWSHLVEKIVLVDLRFAPHNVTPSSHHQNPRHLLHMGWPIRLTTSHANLKVASDRRGLARTFLSAGAPAWMFCVHLCGTLSVRAIEMFNDSPSLTRLALKPCCLPGIVHAQRAEVFQLGNHRFPASEVSANGKWRRGRWVGQSGVEECERKFDKWARHLYEGVAVCEEATPEVVEPTETLSPGSKEAAGGGSAIKSLETIRVQSSWWQNAFIFASREFAPDPPRSLHVFEESRRAAAEAADDSREKPTAAQRAKARADANAEAARLVAEQRRTAKQERRRLRREQQVERQDGDGTGESADSTSDRSAAVCEPCGPE